MAEYGDLNYTTKEINDKLDKSLEKTEQTLTSEEKQQVQKNLGFITYTDYVSQ